MLLSKLVKALPPPTRIHVTMLATTPLGGEDKQLIEIHFQEIFYLLHALIQLSHT